MDQRNSMCEALKMREFELAATPWLVGGIGVSVGICFLVQDLFLSLSSA